MELRGGRSRVRHAFEPYLEQLRQTIRADRELRRETMMQSTVILVIPTWAESESIGAVLSEIPPELAREVLAGRSKVSGTVSGGPRAASRLVTCAAGYSRWTPPTMTAEAT